MSSSGLIYAVIVGAWAAYLVPMWLRRQDELNEARPTERFSTAIRLLSGREAMERRYERTRADSDREAAPAETAGTTGPGGAAASAGGTGSTGAAEASGTSAAPGNVDVRDHAVPLTEVGRPHPVPAARAKVLARRRRTTTLLFLAFTAGAIGAAVGGLNYLWAPAAPGVLLTLYIAHLRRAERRRFEFTMDQRRAVEAARRLRERHRPAAEPAAEPSPKSADRRALVEQTDHAEWVDQQRAPLPADDGWDPVPVPLPTYVTAPVAPRAHAGADAWEAVAAADPDVGRPRDRTPLFDQYAPPPLASSDPLDRPRAANE